MPRDIGASTGVKLRVKSFASAAFLPAADELGLTPYLALGMRLGEGSGCPIAFRVLEAACAAMNDMATFAEAAINDDYLAEIREKDSFTV